MIEYLIQLFTQRLIDYSFIDLIAICAVCFICLCIYAVIVGLIKSIYLSIKREQLMKKLEKEQNKNND